MALSTRRQAGRRHALVRLRPGACSTIEDDRLKVAGRVEVGPEPRGVAISPRRQDGLRGRGREQRGRRGSTSTRAKVTGRLAVGREPRGIALSPDGSLLARRQRAVAGRLGDRRPRRWTVERTIPIEGDNLRQVAISPDGKTGYVANMRNRGFATTANNIDLGWVLGQRLTRVDARRLGAVRHALARPAGQGRGRRPRRGRQPRRQVPGRQSAAGRTRS